MASDPFSRTHESRETGWVNRPFSREESTPEYQELKFTLHRKLLDRINLEALSSTAGERVRVAVRAAVARLVEEQKTPLSLVEKEGVIEEILDEVFGLGPLEPLLADPSVSDRRLRSERGHMTISENGHYALKDMVELQMYLVAQPLQRPWPLLSRSTRAFPEVRAPHRNPIESTVANELVQLGFIEYTSSITLVVSQSGSDYYERKIKKQ